MRAIVLAIEAGDLAARALLVVSNKRQAPALAFAREHDVQALCIPTLADPEGADARLASALADAGVELVLLSGYLRKLGPKTLASFRNRVLNIHPALLPDFGGQGMYGRRVHEAVLASGRRRTGASVHIVDDKYDHGPTLAQVSVPVAPGDTAEDIERRVIAAEPALYIDTLRRLASGDLTLPSA